MRSEALYQCHGPPSRLLQADGLAGTITVRTEGGALKDTEHCPGGTTARPNLRLEGRQVFREGFLEEVTLESSLEGPGAVGQIRKGLGREDQPEGTPVNGVQRSEET